MLQGRSEEFQQFMKKKELAFVEQMKGINQIDYIGMIKDLKSKLQDKSQQVGTIECF